MKKRIILCILAICLLITTLFLRVSKNYTKACEDYAKMNINAIISKDINTIISNNINSNINEYKVIPQVTYNSNGEITSISIDAQQLNLLILNLTNETLDYLKESENQFGIPLGNIFGYKLLSGKGPEIKAEILSTGTINHDIKSELLSGGINQTLHRITVYFTVNIKCIVPFHEFASEINTAVVISETLIVGEIPNIMLFPSD